MECQDVRQLLAIYRELDGEDLIRVKRHLAVCPSCAQVLAEYKAQDHRLASLAQIEPSPQLQEEVWARLGRGRERRPRWATWRRSFGQAIGLALILIIAAGALVWMAVLRAGPLSRPGIVEFQELLSLPVGSLPGQVGIASASGGPPLGPASFAVGDDGLMYLLDTLNARIQVFDDQGGLKSVIPLLGTAFPLDLQVVDANTFYIFDGGIEKVFKFDGEGRKLAAYDIPPAVMDGASGIALETDNDLAVIVGGGARYKLIADGQYVPSLNKEVGLISRRSDYIYVGRNPNPSLGKGSLQVLDRSGLVILEMPITVRHRLGSVAFVDVDRKGNIYVAVEELSTRVEKTIRKYNARGELLSIARIPLEKYYAYPQRDIVVDKEGSIYVLAPTREDAKILKVPLQR